MFETFREAFSKLHTAEGVQELAGPWVVPLVAGIVFAETGLLVGFFLPGDSLLIVAGVIAAKGGFDFTTGAAFVVLAAIVGNQVGYAIGSATGRAVFSRPDGRFIKRKHFDEAHAYYEKNGALSLVLARFVPVLRTFVPLVAGIAAMPRRTFIMWNIVGALLWVGSLMGLGFALGRSAWMKKPEDIEPVILVVVLVSALPLLVGFAKRFGAKWRGR